MSPEAKKIVTAALLLFTVLAWLWPPLMAMHLEQEDRKKRNEPPQYDERQRMARMRAGNHALYVLLGFLAVWAAVDQFKWFWWTSSPLDMALSGMGLAYGVWSVDCILHDASTSWKDKRWDADFLPMTHCGLIFMWLVPTSGMNICDSWMPFHVWCVVIVFLLITAVYKIRKRKKAEAENAP